MKTFSYSILASLLLLSACGDDASGDGGGDAVDAAPGAVDARVIIDLPDGQTPLTLYTELWYSVDDRLVRIVLDKADGGVVSFDETVVAGLPLGFNALTMLDDGSILGVRLSDADGLSYFYHVPDPPREAGASVTPTLLGLMPDSIKLEGLYTDCEGRVYAMDTGADPGSSTGNRLLLLNGNFLASDFSYQVVSDLSSATVADIDDMGPAIVNNEIIDNPGLAIDSGTIYNFDYQTGTGTESGTGGSWGIHAMGKELFDDSVARLYIFNSSAELFEMDPVNSTLSAVLGTGPTDVQGSVGWSGLAGPLTECDSGFEID